MRKNNQPQDNDWVYARYITINGKKVYPKKSKVFKFKRKR
jgi:hypothetical protein